MQDLLPEKQRIFRHIEDVVRRVFAAYGYSEVDFPVIESTQLFKRTVGESTDIVEKEMYTFEDRNGENITLRPEGTAGCVRMAQENGMLFNQIQRIWYSGPMFRYERPQKGRYRQFYQIGGECFGMPGPDIDAELLLLTARVWRELGLTAHIRLELNSMGSEPARQSYREALVSYLRNYQDQLDDDSRRRLESNPLRILDSKVPGTQRILEDAPLLLDYLDDDSASHFQQLQEILGNAGVEYRVNPGIVRGLDYYNRTVFEWVTDTLGAQGTVCGGGRYDGLVEQIGGKATPAVGFAMGLDRLALMLVELEKMEASRDADVYIASIGEVPRREAMLLAEQLRTEHPNLKIVVHCGDGKFKAQLKKADQSGALVALILGEDEIACGEVTVKNLRDGSDQYRIKGEDIQQVLGGTVQPTTNKA
jgi:histidyl-tRNA synthetase